MGKAADNYMVTQKGKGCRRCEMRGRGGGASEKTSKLNRCVRERAAKDEREPERRKG